MVHVVFKLMENKLANCSDYVETIRGNDSICRYYPCMKWVTCRACRRKPLVSLKITLHVRTALYSFNVLYFLEGVHQVLPLIYCDAPQYDW
jgi:hypothetical protein